MEKWKWTFSSNKSIEKNVKSYTSSTCEEKEVKWLEHLASKIARAPEADVYRPPP